MQKYHIEVYHKEDGGLWNQFIDKAENGSIFHRYDWLRVSAKYSKTQLIPLIVYKGKEAVCLLPLFYKKMFGVKMLFSPPPNCATPYMGPIFSISAGNRHNFETTFWGLIDELLTYVKDNVGYDIIRIFHTINVNDMRAYIWNNYEVQPFYTYSIDLSKGTDAIYNSFYKKTKNSLKAALNNDKLKVCHDQRRVGEIIELVTERYLQQDRKYKVNPEFIKTLFETTVGASIHVISMLFEDKLVGGRITLIDNKRAYAWIGAVSRKHNIKGAGELMYWENIREFVAKGYSHYELVGGNTRNLCEYKSKYNPDLVTYFEVKDSTLKGRLVQNLHKIMI